MQSLKKAWPWKCTAWVLQLPHSGVLRPTLQLACTHLQEMFSFPRPTGHVAESSAEREQEVGGSQAVMDGRRDIQEWGRGQPLF